MLKVQRKMKTEVGEFYLVASPTALHGIYWNDPKLKEADAHSAAGQILKKTEGQLLEYFAGKRTSFELPLDAEGTEFQKRVWQRLCQIPYGKTKSYKDIAKELKDANASRAVGTANGKNPLSIVIPCHRVISSDGSLGGYAGGLELKKKLLALELATSS